MKARLKGKRVLWATLAVLLVLVAAGAAYVNDYYRAEPEAVEALAGSENVTVTEEEGLLIFAPEETDAGFVFYPGGKVEYSAYAPLMVALAEENILCLVPQMPANLAVLDVHAAQDLPQRYPEVARWYIGGHSLGGSMAASHIAEDDRFAGLILLASYSTADLSDSGRRVLSIYGTEDGVLNREKYREYHANLPEDAVELVLYGGNHAGFGAYGHQEGDGEMSLGPGQQITVTAETILEFMREG
ncbi:MAG: alpha/beta hydrolase [Oscillospiraceae bacterium]|nr:alpha/beta hydrolase [Oscillospiraceae bacterium]